MATAFKMEIPPLPVEEQAARFSPLDWLVIASARSGTERLIFGRLEELYVGLCGDNGRDKMDALHAMTRIILARGPERFASRVDAFFDAGFSGDQLKMLCRSLAAMRQNEGIPF